MLESEKRGIAGNEWRYGWPIVVAGFVAMLYQNFHVGAVGTLVKPLGDELGWSRSTITTGVMLHTIMMLIFLPVIALLLPRLGARRIVVASSLSLVAGLLTLYFGLESVAFWNFAWIILGASSAGISAVVWTTLITKVFVKSRGLALSVALAGTGVTYFVTPLITAFSLQIWGLKAPFLIFAFLNLCLMLPIMLYITRLRSDFGPFRAGEGADKLVDPSAPEDPGSQYLTMALLITMCGLVGAGVGLFFTHLQAMMVDAGVSVTSAAAYFSVFGPALIAGRLVTGIALDAMPPKLVASVVLAVPGVIAFLMLGYDGSAVSSITVGLLFGLVVGAEMDVICYLTAIYFLGRRYALVYSFAFGTYTICLGLASLVAGIAYDHYRSYEIALYVAIGTAILTILLTNMLPGTSGKGDRVEGLGPSAA